MKYANALILALADDTTTIFATLIARELAPGVEIVARANETDNIGKLYSAGADYVLALETVSGRMLASTILEGEEIISPDKQIEILQDDRTAVEGPEFAGRRGQNPDRVYRHRNRTGRRGHHRLGSRFRDSPRRPTHHRGNRRRHERVRGNRTVSSLQTTAEATHHVTNASMNAATMKTGSKPRRT